MPIKRTSKEKTVPVVFQMPAEMVSELKGKRAENDLGILKEMKSSLAEFQESFTQHRLSVQSDLLKHRTGNKKEMDDLSKELEEAFDILWPKFKELESSIEKNVKEGRESVSKIDKKHGESIADLTTQILELSERIEKRYHSSLKKLNQQKGTVEIRTDEGETRFMKEEIKRIESLVKEFGKYEYGSSLNIFSNDTPVGFTGILNFKSGFTVALNASGGIDITASASGGGLGFLVATGTVNNTNKTFTFASAPTLVVVNGFAYRDGHGVAITGTSAVLDNAPTVGGDVYGLG